jgi:hypothetical protein
MARNSRALAAVAGAKAKTAAPGSSASRHMPARRGGASHQAIIHHAPLFCDRYHHLDAIYQRISTEYAPAARYFHCAYHAAFLRHICRYYLHVHRTSFGWCRKKAMLFFSSVSVFHWHSIASFSNRNNICMACWRRVIFLRRLPRARAASASPQLKRHSRHNGAVVS